MAEPIRLQRYLSQAGVAARRKAEELILAGRVTVNGAVVRELGTKVNPELDNVLVDGEGIAAEELFYVLFNKPKGCITAVSDDRGRPTVMDYLPNLPASVAPVGRLDFYSEGVLLLTNDGELAARLLAPKNHVPKTYHVKIRGQMRPGALQVLRDGVRLEDGTMTTNADVEELPGESKHSWLAITLYEGKSRQIHRMMESLGFTVTKLQRVAFANLTFHGLRVGDARELSQAEVNDLRDLAKLPRVAVSRGKWKARREDTDIARRRHARAEAEAAAAAEAAALARASRPSAPPPSPYDDDAPAPPRRGRAARPAPPPRPEPPRSRGSSPAPVRTARPARDDRSRPSGPGRSRDDRGRSAGPGRGGRDDRGRPSGSAGPGRSRDDRGRPSGSAGPGRSRDDRGRSAGPGRSRDDRGRSAGPGRSRDDRGPSGPGRSRDDRGPSGPGRSRDDRGRSSGPGRSRDDRGGSPSRAGGRPAAPPSRGGGRPASKPGGRPAKPTRATAPTRAGAKRGKPPGSRKR